MKKLNFFLLFLLLVACAGTLCGCADDALVNSEGPSETSDSSHSGPESNSSRVAVAFVTNQIADFWRIAEVGATDAGKEFNADVSVVMPPEATAVVQKQKVEDLLTKGVEGVAISPLDAENQVDWLDSIAERVPMITHDSDAPESQRLMYIGMDNYAGGRMCGELVKEAVPDGGKVIIAIGRLEQDNSKYRRQGVIDELLNRDRDTAFYLDQPGSWDPPNEELIGDQYSIITTLTDQGKPEVALAKAEDALNTWPDIKAMVGLFGYNPPALYQALKKSDQLGKIAMIGFDEDAITLQAIKDGHCVGTVVQNPYEYGYQSVQVLTELIRGNSGVIPDSKYVDIPPRKITADNVDEFWEDLRTKTGQ
jgi:ribose transport system substrate-binding protein